MSLGACVIAVVIAGLAGTLVALVLLAVYGGSRGPKEPRPR